MEADAVVAAQRDTHRERDQFLGLGVQRSGLQRRLGQPREVAHDVSLPGSHLAERILQPTNQLVPVQVHGILLLIPDGRAVRDAACVLSWTRRAGAVVGDETYYRE